jgi:hypothetical protein
MTKIRRWTFTEMCSALLKRMIYPWGGEFRWLTLVSPEGPDDIEVLLEPMGFAPAKVYQKALFEAGIPLTMFTVNDIQQEYERMVKLDVVFPQQPTSMGPVTVAKFEDGCGNLIQLLQKN